MNDSNHVSETALQEVSIDEDSKGKADTAVAVNHLSYEPRAWRKARITDRLKGNLVKKTRCYFFTLICSNLATAKKILCIRHEYRHSVTSSKPTQGCAQIEEQQRVVENVHFADQVK